MRIRRPNNSFVTIIDGSQPSHAKAPRARQVRSGLPSWRKALAPPRRTSAAHSAQTVKLELNTDGATQASPRIETIHTDDFIESREVISPKSRKAPGAERAWLGISDICSKGVARIAAVASKLPRGAVLAFAIAAVTSVGAGVLLGGRDFPLGSAGLIIPDESSAQAALISYLSFGDPKQDEASIGELPPVPQSVTVQSYTVRSGDTMERIAKRFGLRQDSIISMNNIASASSLRAGMQLRIPNMDGVAHTVRRGESLSSIASSYGVDMTAIVDANDIASSTIRIGQSLFVPQAKLSTAKLREFYGESFIWPARGPISSPYGYRSNPFSGAKTFHSAVDIVVPIGTRVRATNDGSVADTGYNSVFGNYVILRHASGYQSLYAHLSKISVKEGGSVSQGDTLGLSGNTGQSTGPHLHFSIFKNGQALDPVRYVK